MWWWLAGCHGLDATGASGMVGRVLSPEGTPLAGVRVESVEAQAVTDADGRFAVAYKRPDTWVHLHHEGLWLRRVWQEGVDPAVVELRLPVVEPGELLCPAQACQGELAWDLPGGWVGLLSVACAPGERRPVVLAEGAPRLSCRAGFGEEPTAIALARSGSLLRPAVEGPRLRLVGPPPEADCQVTVANRVAEAVGAGWYQVELSQPGWAVATCVGRPSVPQRVSPGDAEVELSWAPAGPRLHLPPGTDHALLVAEDVGWVLPFAGSPAALPPLPAGSYRVLAFAGPQPSPELFAANPAAGEGEGLRFQAVPGGAVARLVLPSPRVDGDLGAE